MEYPGVKDHFGRVLMVNQNTTGFYATHQDLWHWIPDERALGLAMTVFWLLLTAISTLMRMYTRFRITRTAGIDDYSMILSQILFIGYCGFLFVGYVYGYGLYRDQMLESSARMAFHFWYIGFPSFALVTTSIKMSLALFLLRFATCKAHRYLLYIIMAGCITVGFGYFTFLMLSCAPYSHLWDLTPGAAGYCFDSMVIRNVTFFVAAVDTIADIFAAIVPALIVLKVSMSVASRVGVVFLLLLGSTATIATAVRIYYGVSFDQQEGEFLHDTAPLILLTTIELGAGVCAANLATLRPLFKILARRFGFREPIDRSKRITRADAENWYKSIPVGLTVVRPPSPISGPMRDWHRPSVVALPYIIDPLDVDSPLVDSETGRSSFLSAKQSKHVSVIHAVLPK